MADHPKILPGNGVSDLLLVADHISAHVPDDVPLCISGDLLVKHIAVDIGIELLATEVCDRLECPAVLAGISRLVVDLHRERDHPATIPEASDGHRVPGNEALDEAAREARLRQFWDPYHAAVAQQIDWQDPAMLFTLHSFTPQLETAAEQSRPWQIGILYNRDERAPRIAIPRFEALGLRVGDNEPYSGRQLNATMNLHAEARGLPYLAIEIRNDLIGNAEDTKKWAEIITPVIAETRDALVREGAID